MYDRALGMAEEQQAPLRLRVSFRAPARLCDLWQVRPTRRTCCRSRRLARSIWYRSAVTFVPVGSQQTADRGKQLEGRAACVTARLMSRRPRGS